MKKMLSVIQIAFILVPACFGRVLDSQTFQAVRSAKMTVKPSENLRRAFLHPTLSIRSRPSRVINVMAGEGKYLECEAGGSPAPTIHWLKDGKKMPQNMYDNIGSEEDNDLMSSKPRLGLGFTRSRLFIDCATAKDTGIYTCVAENAYLRDSKSGEVLVTQELESGNDALCMAKKTYGSPARIHMWTHTRLEIMGSDVTLFCRSNGAPQPQVTWKGPNENVLEDSQKYQMLDNGDLLIHNIQWSDMGGYMCHVENAEGSDETLIFLYPTLVKYFKNPKVEKM
ncbi:zwei Ig domain protein zig-2-like [Uloborus diversus]|uniref:zwei Ig domain protein zig-2-like n=1 Tax=Uloborus diversus TaxID=327109 RepID=UPI00240A114E|nr:zwei Ig domain protein zig-2-like [Uloborus diversus]